MFGHFLHFVFVFCRYFLDFAMSNCHTCQLFMCPFHINVMDFILHVEVYICPFSEENEFSISPILRPFPIHVVCLRLGFGT